VRCLLVWESPLIVSLRSGFVSQMAYIIYEYIYVENEQAILKAIVILPSKFTGRTECFKLLGKIIIVPSLISSISPVLNSILSNIG
jgi:hypothetical protein